MGRAHHGFRGRAVRMGGGEADRRWLANSCHASQRPSRTSDGCERGRLRICDTNMDDQWQPNGEMKNMLINEGKALAARIGGPGPPYIGLMVFTCGSAEPIRLLPREAEPGHRERPPLRWISAR